MGVSPSANNQDSSPVTPPAAATAFFHVLAMQYLAVLSQAVGRPANETAYWAQRHSTGQQAYHARFYNATAGGYSPCVGDVDSKCFGTSSHGSQTSNAMALMLGAPPSAAVAAAVAASLAADVVSFGNRTTSGVVGMGPLFPALDEWGYDALALAVLRGDRFPSIGFMAAQNWTTLCENLGCTAHDPAASSGNHIMLGAFDAWLVQALGGLDSVVNGTTGGWEHIKARVAPAAVAVSASEKS
jgi:alpha-L-rhamnosidase